jgi:carnosine N-methyltransferase
MGKKKAKKAQKIGHHHQHDQSNNIHHHQHDHHQPASSSSNPSHPYIPNAQPLHSSDNQSSSSPVNTDNEHQEAIHFYTVLSAFSLYEIHSFQHIQIRENYFKSLETQHKHILGEKQLQLRFDLQRTAVTCNYNLLRRILPQENTIQNNDGDDELPRQVQIHFPSNVKGSVRVSDDDMEKVHSTIKQLMRDWSDEGRLERQQTYGTIIDELLNFYSEHKTPESRSGIRVLTPGAGLGRLTWEIARLGFASQGNEFSFYMLLTANMILNEVTGKDAFTFYPFLHQNINVLSINDQIKPTTIPDVNPASLSDLLRPHNKAADLSMVAGDFVEVYNDPYYHESFNCVVTCFFIDTGKNIFKYIDTIHKILKPGGLWINLGPLLYHYAEMPNTFSIELTYEEVKQVIQHKNRFNITKERQLDCTYCGNDRSMLSVVYKCMLFTAVKQ